MKWKTKLQGKRHQSELWSTKRAPWAFLSTRACLTTRDCHTTRAHCATRGQYSTGIRGTDEPLEPPAPSRLTLLIHPAPEIAYLARCASPSTTACTRLAKWVNKLEYERCKLLLSWAFSMILRASQVVEKFPTIHKWGLSCTAITSKPERRPHYWNVPTWLFR